MNLELFISPGTRPQTYPLAVPGTEPGDVLKIYLKNLSPNVAALGYAALVPADLIGPMLLSSYGGCLFPALFYPENVLYLPVFFPGGGLILGNPVWEKSAPANSPWESIAEITVHTDFPLQRPRLENNFGLYFLSSHRHAGKALNLAWQDTLSYLQRACYCSREKALQLAGTGQQTAFYCAPGLPAVTVCISLPKSVVRGSLAQIK